MNGTMDEVTKQGSEFISDLTQAARRYPFSTALIGMGMLWMFVGDRTRKNASELIRHRLPAAADEALDNTRSALRSGAEAVGDGIASAADALQGSVGGTVTQATRLGRQQAAVASRYVRNIPETGAEMISAVQSSMSELFKTQPLALGVVGLAIGAGIAASLPETDIEAAYLGEASDAVKQKAAEFAGEQADRVVAAGERAFNAGAEEASRQGLTVEEARSAAMEVSRKVGRVVETAATKAV